MAQFHTSLQFDQNGQGLNTPANQAANNGFLFSDMIDDGGMSMSSGIGPSSGNAHDDHMSLDYDTHSERSYGAMSMSFKSMDLGSE